MATPVKRYIPENSDPQIEKFINCLMQKGKKSTARRIFWDAVEAMKKRTKEDPIEIFQKALLNATPLVEVRPKRVGGAVYQVPTEVPAKRQQSLSVRWMVGAARERKGARMADKLALELLDAAGNQGGAVKKKEDIQRMAQANKAFAHLAK
ncbi:MAG TPA: 30S ribosomal protein S7 [Candidatus Peribacterales bacterium]|nr:30S ribosomal protein S7 [Candidatus Peribacterales bacterium]